MNIRESSNAASSGSLQGAIRRLDHVTYAVKLENEKSFIERWRILGFRELVRLNTEQFPATHIALTSSDVNGSIWGVMTGLSVSEDPSSPVNRFIDRYGEGIQHSAYGVDASLDMDQVREWILETGWTLMTPVLTYKDNSGALLKQLFVAPQRPYGTFVEFIQRLTGPAGTEFDGFDIRNIDGLYQQYEDYSQWLLKRQ